MNTATSDMSFLPEAGEISDHRSVSRLALIALGAAFLSPVALIHPLLSFVAWGAVVLAFLALLTMTDREVGRGLAVVALIPGLAFGAFGPTRYISRQQKVFRDAGEFAQQWLRMVEGGLHEEAHQLTLTFFQRVPGTVSLQEHYANPMIDMEGIPTEEQRHSPFTDLVQFRSSDPISTLITWEDGFDIEFLGSLESNRGTTESETVGITYRLNGKGDSSGESVKISLVMQRFVKDRVGYWRVFEFSNPDAPRVGLSAYDMQ